MLIDILLGFLTYGSGVLLGLGIGFPFGLYASLLFWDKYLNYKAVKDPGEAIRKAIREYYRLNDSLYEAEKWLDFPEAVKGEDPK